MQIKQLTFIFFIEKDTKWWYEFLVRNRNPVMTVRTKKEVGLINSCWILIKIILQDNDFFSDDGIPKNPFPNGWKGEAGLYAVGFTRKGLFGASLDAMSVAHDIANRWKEESKQQKKTAAARHRRCISHF